MRKRKKIIFIVICFLVITLILNYIGVITLPKDFIIKYFKDNQQDFEDVVNYLNNGSFSSYSKYDVSVFSISDLDIRLKIIKILIFGGYSRIAVTKLSDEYTVEFQNSNLFVDKGEPYCIRYSLIKSDEDAMSTETFKMRSEMISDNWYYWYRKS